MRQSMLPPAGENLFQRVKQQREEARARGIKIINLAIGQPSGPAILEARKAAAEAVMSDEESMHEYQDNGSPGVPNFARRFVQEHIRHEDLHLIPTDIDFLPIPGIKPMLGEVIKAMGYWSRDDSRDSVVYTMTNPGYPTPADQCKYNGVKNIPLFLEKQNGFLFDLKKLEPYLRPRDLIMLNFPHNPTGIIAKQDWLHDLCKLCQDKDVRIFNDAAYAILSHDPNAFTLTDVAIDFPDLSWVEAFSASKAGNNTGWRVGAMAGSPDFIGNIKRGKGNSDSGFAAFAAAGIIHLYENHMDKIDAVRRTYASRLLLVSETMKAAGMRLAVEPKAGFFLLFDSPEKAFGEEIPNAERFNEIMIERTGIVGVPFGKYIRYAVCATDISPSTVEDIQRGFEKAEISY